MMRKLFLSVFGLLLLTSAFLFTSDAQESICNLSSGSSYGSGSSRGVYRPFSNRRGPWNSYNYRKSSYGKKKDSSLCGAVRRNPGGLYPKYRRGQIRNARVAREVSRLASPQFYPRAENVRTSGVGKVVVRHTNQYTAYNQKPYLERTVKFRQNQTKFRPVALGQEAFVNIPDTFRKVDDFTYESRRGPLKIRVTKTPARYSCKLYKFSHCVRDLREDFLSEQDLQFVFGQGSETKLSRTLVGQRQKYPVFRETFTANSFGEDRLYMNFYALDPRDESMMQIQLVTHQSDARDASQIAEDLFTNFKFQ